MMLKNAQDSTVILALPVQEHITILFLYSCCYQHLRQNNTWSHKVGEAGFIASIDRVFELKE